LKLHLSPDKLIKEVPEFTTSEMDAERGDSLKSKGHLELAPLTTEDTNRSPLKSRGKELSPEQEKHKELLIEAKRTKMADRRADWVAKYEALLNPTEKNQYSTLIAKNKKLKDELKAIVAATEQVIIKEKYILFTRQRRIRPVVDDSDERKRKRILLEQQSQMVALRNTIQEKRRRLDEAFHYKEIRQLEDQKANLIKQWEVVEKELQDSRKDHQNQQGMVESLDNGIFSKQNEKRLKQDLLAAKLEKKMMSDQKADLERELNEKHIMKISAQKELRELKARVAEATRKKNNEGQVPAPVVDDQAFEAIFTKLKEINHEKEVCSLDFEEEIINLEMLSLELKKEKARLEASIADRKWTVRHNQVKIKDFLRIGRYREALGGKKLAKMETVSTQEDHLAYLVDKGGKETARTRDKNNSNSLNGGKSQEIETVLSKDESRLPPKDSLITVDSVQKKKPGLEERLDRPKPLPKLEPISGISSINNKGDRKADESRVGGVDDSHKPNPSTTGAVKLQPEDKKDHKKPDNGPKETTDAGKFKDQNEPPKPTSQTVAPNKEDTKPPKGNPDPLNDKKPTENDDLTSSKVKPSDNGKVADSTIKIIEKPGKVEKEKFDNKLDHDATKKDVPKQPSDLDKKGTKPDPNLAKPQDVKKPDDKPVDNKTSLPKMDSKIDPTKDTTQGKAPDGANRGVTNQSGDPKKDSNPAGNTNLPKPVATTDQKADSKTPANQQLPPETDPKGQDKTLKMTSKTPTFSDPSKVPTPGDKKLDGSKPPAENVLPKDKPEVKPAQNNPTVKDTPNQGVGKPVAPTNETKPVTDKDKKPSASVTQPNTNVPKVEDKLQDGSKKQPS
jgi:hypothetical protein